MCSCPTSLHKEKSVVLPPYVRACRNGLSLLLLGALVTTASAQSLTLGEAAKPDSVATQAAPAPSTSSDAQALYAKAKADLVQIRVLTRGSNSRSSVGSGFVMDQGPYIVTNYHVIASLALEPKSYQGQYISTDGREGSIELIAVDVARDLAVVKADIKGAGFFRADNIASESSLRQGEKLFSLGNPLDLGFSITEGNYNGVSNRGVYGNLMYTGPVNSGMSGGPNITSRGELAGVNVAARRDGELVSFLVLGEYVGRLLEQVAANPAPAADFRPVIAAQLVEYQSALKARILDTPFNTRRLGQFSAPVRDSEQMRCWGGSNTNHKSIETTNVRCAMESRVFVAGELQTGYIAIQHQLIQNKLLNTMKFAKMRETLFSDRVQSTTKSNTITSAECHEDFVKLDGTNARTVLCAEAYHNFPGIYDMTFDVVTLTGNDATLISSMQVYGVAFDTGLAFTGEFLSKIARYSDTDTPPANEAPLDRTAEPALPSPATEEVQP